MSIETHARRDHAGEDALAMARQRGAITASTLFGSGRANSLRAALRVLRRLEQRGLLSCRPQRLTIECTTYRQRRMVPVFMPTAIDAPVCEAAERESIVIDLLQKHQLLTTKQLTEMSGIKWWRVVRVMQRLHADGVIETCKGAQDGPGGLERRYWLKEANHA